MLLLTTCGLNFNHYLLINATYLLSVLIAIKIPHFAVYINQNNTIMTAMAFQKQEKTLITSSSISSIIRKINIVRSVKQTETHRKLRILSIDGGGIRAVLPAMVLAALEEKIQNESGNPDARIVDYFDFFAGTSAGGILISLYLTPCEKKSESTQVYGQGNFRYLLKWWMQKLCYA